MRSGSSLRIFGGVEREAEFVLHPAAGGADAEIVGQESRPFAEIDLLDRLARRFDEQHLADFVAADFLQIAIAEVQLPARVENLASASQFHSVSSSLLGQVFLDGVEDLRFGGPFGFVLGQPLGGGEIEAAKSLGSSSTPNRPPAHLANVSRAVVLVEELVEVMRRSARRSSRGSAACSCAPSRIRWR